MPTFPFLQVDAFSDRPLAGNPCAVVFDGESLDDDTMLAIAREMNLSETAFVVPSHRADVGARYFTPLGEIPMAGHPTVATLHALVDTGRLDVPGARREVTLELPAGVLPVEIEMRDGRVERVTMTQLRPGFGEPLPAERVAPAFRLAASDLDPDLPVCVVSTGTPQLMIPLRDATVLGRIVHDGAAHAVLARELEFFSTHLFAAGGGEGGGTVARHFAPGSRGFEDPFTGSATGSMAALLPARPARPALRGRAGRGPGPSRTCLGRGARAAGRHLGRAGRWRRRHRPARRAAHR